MDLKANPYKAVPLERHRLSLESIISFHSGPPVLPESVRTQADTRLHHILKRLEDDAKQQPEQPKQSYNRATLVRLTYEYSQSEDSKSLFLSSFFGSLALPLEGQSTDSDVNFDNPEVAADLRISVDAFAEYLMDNFFLPLKAASNKTPQPSPITHSAVQRAQGSALPQQQFVGTTDRLSTLRGTCLVRDRHRCVVTRKFDLQEGRQRYNAVRGGIVLDDDELPLAIHDTMRLEVAHIFPHSLTKTSANSSLDPAKKAALDILNMFDLGVVDMIEGTEIDRPFNAITLTQTHHADFGAFEFFFEPIPNEPPHTYRIDAFTEFSRQALGLPVIRTLYLTKDRNIEPPSPRLLAIHRAIGYILHLSAAGNYIDQLLRDAEEYGVRSDGSTELGRLVTLSLGGWVGGVGIRA